MIITSLKTDHNKVITADFFKIKFEIIKRGILIN